ncbi:MAG: family 16 glycoside hydrolase [Saprospiraceae bacterium]
MLSSRTFYLILAVLLIGLYFWSARQTAAPAPERPNDPWVFRSVLDKQPRMITFALNDKLWVSYSTENCALYKAWAGGVDFDGAVYTMRHGPQPVSVGNAWFENAYPQPWTVVRNGKPEQPQTDYKGHRYLDGGQAEIMYDLVLADGKRIRINERPEFVERDRQAGFSRTFVVENVPDDVMVYLRTNAGSIADPTNIETNGTWETTSTKPNHALEGVFALEVDGQLTLHATKPTELTTMFVPAPLYPNPFQNNAEAAEAAVVSPGERLMAKSDCRICHNPRMQTVGPGYVQIAERYKNTPANVEALAQKVIAGGAGTWGIAAMSAHPDLQLEDAKTIVGYILDLDEGEDDGEGGGIMVDPASIPASNWKAADSGVNDGDMRPGLIGKLFKLQKSPNSLDEINFNAPPAKTVLAPNIDAGVIEFTPYKNDVALQATGYLYLEKDDNVLLRLGSDDGSRLYLDGQLLIDNDGRHGTEMLDAEVALRAGYHALRLDYFQAGGGMAVQLKWARSGDPTMQTIPPTNFAHQTNADNQGLPVFTSAMAGIPGDGLPLTAVHPSYDLAPARPDEFLPKIGGLDFLSDGRMVVSTWDPTGGVYILSNVESGNPKKIKVKQIAKGLAEPLGLKVVDDTIYVLQKQELTRLVDTDGDEIIDEYQCVAKSWRTSANFHEFAFGLAYKDGYFYATLAIAILPGGASARPQIPDRGKVVQINRTDGHVEFIARGLRTPNGIGIGPDNELFVADNQGDWLPSSKILHVTPGAFFNSYAVDSQAVAGLPVQAPVVWLPQDEIGNSPTQPIVINDGPYKNQLLHGDVCYGGLQRVFMEKVSGAYQGCVFRFAQGLEGGTNRLAWGPDGALYVGMIGNPGNWGQTGKFWYGLQRLKHNGKSTFEMLAVRAKTNGLEIEFTEPLREGDGWEPENYAVRQWWYQPTSNYGGPKMDETELTVASATVSADRKKVFLEIPGIKRGNVVHIRLHDLPLSELDHEIWTTEAWYTMNNIPENNPGIVAAHPVFPQVGDNELTDLEKAAGWELLFDGKTIDKWRNYNKNTLGKAWIINDHAIHLQTKALDGGAWQQRDGGDIVSMEEYQDFELKLDWKIGPCGNSGIIYNVVEDSTKYQYVWQTGPEMQVLDNTCHPDARIIKHRAGDLYDLISCKYEMVKPAGQWNHVRLVSKNGKVEHWLNNRKLVEYDMNSPEWPKMIAGSKFRDMPGFGKARRGRIALQDHGDPVWYKNIKIRKL